jgi:hypothetical protein
MRKQVNAYLPKSLAAALKKEAKAEDRSVSQMATVLTREALDARESRRNSKAA